MKNKWKTLVTCVLAAMCVSLTSCSHNSGTVSSVESLPEPAQSITKIYQSYDYPVATNLEGMISNADYVVVGKYTGFDSTWNMSRNPNNPAEADDDNYTEGRLYCFEIEEVLLGEIEEEEILVNQKYSNTVSITESNAVLNQAGEIIQPATESQTFDVVVHYPLYIEPELNTTYVLFLHKNTSADNYYGACEPFIVQVNSNETVELKSNLIGQQTSFNEVAYSEEGNMVECVTEMGEPLLDTISGDSFEDFRLAVLDCLE